MNRQVFSIFMAALLLGVFLPISPSRAETDVDTFGWVRAVYVTVGISSSSASFKHAITESQVRAVVERKLRAGGVPLVGRDEWAGHTDVGFVEVDITAIDVEGHPIYAVATCLQLNLWLNRYGTTNRNEAAPGTTWQESSVVSIGRAAAREQGIGVLLDGHVDKFVAAWKEAHAKQSQGLLEHLHVHRLRHTFACQWLERGGSLAALQQILGHASIVTTQRYARLTDEAVMREAARIGGGE